MNPILKWFPNPFSTGLRIGTNVDQLNAQILVVDSDLAGDIDGRRSTTDVLFKLGACLICQSQKHKVVALSTCESEYIAAATEGCQGTWLHRLLQDITKKELPTPVLKVDNKSAIALAKNLILRDRSKHIDTRFHFILSVSMEDRSSSSMSRSTGSSRIFSPRPLGNFSSRS